MMKLAKLRMASTNLPCASVGLLRIGAAWMWQDAPFLTPLSPAPYLPRSPARGYGAVAQMVERLVRNEEVRGSIPLGSTSPSPFHRPLPAAVAEQGVGRDVEAVYPQGGAPWPPTSSTMSRS